MVERHKIATVWNVVNLAYPTRNEITDHFAMGWRPCFYVLSPETSDSSTMLRSNLKLLPHDLDLLEISFNFILWIEIKTRFKKKKENSKKQK